MKFLSSFDGRGRTVRSRTQPFDLLQVKDAPKCGSLEAMLYWLNLQRKINE